MSDDERVQHFQSMYEGTPPWDVGRPQQPFVEIAETMAGSVLDAGCGTGENALFFAERGHSVLGIDFTEVAIKRAKEKAQARGIHAEFLRMDALQLATLDRRFDNAIDCGLFHVLSDSDRIAYVAGLAHVLKPGGMLLLMCFSDEEPAGWGPRRITQDEIRQVLADDWTIQSIRPARFESNPHAGGNPYSEGGPKAWFAVILRRG